MDRVTIKFKNGNTKVYENVVNYRNHKEIFVELDNGSTHTFSEAEVKSAICDKNVTPKGDKSESLNS